MAKGNNKAWGLVIALVVAILGGLGAERNSTWNALAQLGEKKVDKSQYEKDLATWQKRLDEAVSRIEKEGISVEARAAELRKVMDKLLLELRGPAR